METRSEKAVLHSGQTLSLEEQIVQLQRIVIRMASDMRRIVGAGVLTNEALMLLADEVMRLQGEDVPERVRH